MKYALYFGTEITKSNSVFSCTTQVMAIVADFMLVYLSAPTLSLQPALGTIGAIISEVA
jgi:hypothetical protein